MPKVSGKKVCGICGKGERTPIKLKKTECCDNWICNDEFLKYKNSCDRAHRRESICGYHYSVSHPGKWEDCEECIDDMVDDEYPIDESLYEKPAPEPKKNKAASDPKVGDECPTDESKNEKFEKSSPKPKKRKAASVPKVPLKKKACGLCGKTRKLTKTDCCDNWICDDEHKYRLFSYALNSCSRNHRRYSTCAFHNNEGHQGKWQDCNKCKEECLDDTYEIDESFYERKPRAPKAKKPKKAGNSSKEE